MASLRAKLFYVAGIGFLALSRAKHALRGYASPKPFDISDTARCVAYDIQVVDHWLSHLRRYTGDDSLNGKTVLELGPGSDLGIGLYLISKGCSRYYTCDVNDLTRSTPDGFYEALFRRIESMNPDADIDSLREQLRGAQSGNPSRLSFVVRRDFDLVQAFGTSSVDLVFSQAAFEHFDDIETTLSQLSVVCRPGAVLVAEIDLKTHSRWIRDKDPNNIYRYQRPVYNAFRFRGIPNRVRPFRYKQVLESLGWSDVSIVPLTRLDDIAGSHAGMSMEFSDARNQMDYLTIVLCARKRS